MMKMNTTVMEYCKNTLVMSRQWLGYLPPRYLPLALMMTSSRYGHLTKMKMIGYVNRPWITMTQLYGISNSHQMDNMESVWVMTSKSSFTKGRSWTDIWNSSRSIPYKGFISGQFMASHSFQLYTKAHTILGHQVSKVPNHLNHHQIRTSCLSPVEETTRWLYWK